MHTYGTQVCGELEQVKGLQEDLERLVEDTAAKVKELQDKVAFLSDERDTLVQENMELKSTGKHQQQQMSLKDDQIKALQHSSSVLQQDLDQVIFVRVVCVLGNCMKVLQHNDSVLQQNIFGLIIWIFLVYIRTYLHRCIHAYIRTCIHTYTHMGRPKARLTYSPSAWVPLKKYTYIHSYIQTYIHTYMYAYIWAGRKPG
jgi:hypothetical protein